MGQRGPRTKAGGGATSIQIIYSVNRTAVLTEREPQWRSSYCSGVRDIIETELEPRFGKRSMEQSLDAGPCGFLADRVAEAFESASASTDGSAWMSPHLSRLKKAIQKSFGPTALRQIGIESDNRRKNHTAYRLATPPELIRILPARNED